MHVHHAGEHQPTDDLRCAVCPGLTPWPCPPARAVLRATFEDLDDLLAHLGQIHARACRVLAGIPAGRLRAQLVGWAEPPATPPRQMPAGWRFNRGPFGALA